MIDNKEIARLRRIVAEVSGVVDGIQCATTLFESSSKRSKLAVAVPALLDEIERLRTRKGKPAAKKAKVRR